MRTVAIGIVDAPDPGDAVRRRLAGRRRRALHRREQEPGHLVQGNGVCYDMKSCTMFRDLLVGMGDDPLIALRAGWGLDDTMVPWCPECNEQAAPSLVYQKLAELHPGLRSSIICAYQDGIVTNLYRLLNYDLNVLDNDKLHRGLVDLHETLTAAMPGHRDFFYASDRHGALVLPYGDTPGLLPFLSAQLDGDPDWASVVP